MLGLQFAILQLLCRPTCPPPLNSDTATGRCNCATQFGSGDGAGAKGLLGDCGDDEVVYGFGQSLFPRRLRTDTSATFREG